MMTKWTVALLMTVFVGAWTPVQGAEEKTKPEPEEVFKKKDKDSNGVLSEDEFVGKAKDDKLEAAKKQFAAKDADKDGKLTLEEFKAKVKKEKTK
jgi:Ca2+-binding EF-hand superfamily protein